MPSLYILRHGKAEWTSSDGDHARLLQARGQDEARTVGSLLAQKDEAPEIVYSSTAERARQTAELAKEEGDWEAQICLEDALYEASVSLVIDIVRGTEACHQRVLVCGHQPTCGILIGELTRSAAPDFPTAALARVDFEFEDWDRLCVGSGKLEWIVASRGRA